MNIDLIKWVLGAIGGLVVVVVGAVAWLSMLVFKIGQKYGAVETQLETIEKAGEKLEKANERLEMIPVIKVQVEQLGLAFVEERRRFNSVFPEVQQKVTALWERVFSLQNWRASRPNINGNGNGGGT